MDNLRSVTIKEDSRNENLRELQLIGGHENGSDSFPSNQLKSSRFTLWNVIPKSIFEQFLKFSNLWFLFIVLISFIDPEDTWWHRLIRLIPLLFILLINLFKDILNCIEQLTSDKKLNSQKFSVWNGQDFVQKCGMEICVGDIILVLDKELVPADTLLLYVESQSSCYADTSLVLGERNLQVKKPVKDTQTVLTGENIAETITNLKRLNGNIFVKNNNKDQEFIGKIKLKISPRATRLVPENLLLRGSIVMNTPWVLGYVLYTGSDTSYWIKKKKQSRSETDSMLEKWVFYVFVFTFFLVLLLSLLSIFAYEWPNSSQIIFNLIKITQDLTPISLFLVVCITRIGNATKIEKLFPEIQVKDPEYLEDLGLIEYIIADKTGTITRNELSVQVCIIGESVYWKSLSATFDENVDVRDNSKSHRYDSDVLDFKDLRSEIEKGSRIAYHYLLCMALCNHTSAKDMGQEYFSLSVDDKILVETAAFLGMKLLTRTNHACTLNFIGQELEFLVVGSQYFSSETKKCRILVRDSRYDYAYLYVKGSKEDMLEIFHMAYEEKTNIEEFTLSKNLIRMRTVLMGFKQLSAKELEEFDFSYQTALSSPVNASGRIDAVFEQLEKNCEYLGIAAFEDLIDDETRECLHLFANAGIKTWITSGDNEESTLTAGVSSKLFEENVRIVRLTNFSNEEECRSVMTQQIKEHILHDHHTNRENSNSFINESEDEDSPEFRIRTEPMIFLGIHNSSIALPDKKMLKNITSASSPREINNLMNKQDHLLNKLEFNPNSVYFVLSIDKTGLEFGLANDNNRKLFISILFAAHCVCFHSLQFEHKIKVVKLLKKNFKFSPVVLAIGDGQSDAGMLRKAHIGVGITRLQSQLSTVANFSLAHFSQLKSLLLTHGHWNCVNLSTILTYSVYSQFLLMTVLLLFNTMNQLSAIVFIDDELIAIYWVILPIVQMIGVGLYDKDISEEQLYNYPQVYSLGIHKKIITLNKVLFTIAEAIFHGLIICVLYFIGLNSLISQVGRTIGLSDASFWMNLSMFCICSLKLLTETHSLYFHTIFGYFVSIFIVIIHVFCRAYYSGQWVGENNILWQCPTLAILVFTVPLIIFTIEYFFQCGKTLFWPDVLEYVKSIKDTEISFDLVPRLDAFKDELRRVYKKSSTWNSKKDNDSLELNKKTLRFYSDRQETEYNLGKIIENITTYKKMIVLGSALASILMICVMVIESPSDYPKYTIFPGLLILFFIVIPVSRSSFFKKHFKLVLSLYYIIGVITLTIISLVYEISLVDGFSICQIIFFIAFNNDWLSCLIISLLSAISAFICSYFFFSVNNESTNLTILFIIFYSGILLTSASIGYNIDKTKRHEFILIRKVEIEVDKSKSVLSYLLPSFVRKRVKDGIRYIADDQGLVSVLFCDIMDFEEIVATFTPVELTAFLDDVFGKFDQICSVVGVTKIETVGKTYMACAGLKDSDAEMDPYFSTVMHSRRAVEMGLAIIRTVSTIHLRKGVTLGVKIGINSGNVTAGVIGSHKPQFSLVGDTVNTASRMASTCPSHNSLQISNSTYELLDDKRGLVFSERTTEVKGKGNMKTWTVRVPVGLIETSLHEFSVPLSSNKISNSPAVMTVRTVSLYPRSSFVDATVNHERRLSALLTHLEISDAVQLFQRKDTELIEQVQWFSLRCNEKIKEKKFRIETVENNQPVIRIGLVVILVCNGLSILFYVVFMFLSQFQDYFYVSKLCIEFIFELLLLVGLRTYGKQLWYAWSLQLVYFLSVIAEIIIGIFETRSITIQFLSFLLHLLLFSHCAELFLKHNFWNLVLASGLWIAHSLSQCEVGCIVPSIYSLIALSTLIFTVYTSERTLRINSTLKAAANKELDKTEKLIKQMMPPHVVQNLKEQSTITDRIPQVTVVYADIVGFTAWSSLRTPEEIVNMLSELFTMFDKNCEEHKVYKVHTIGDCYVAMGFTGQANRDPALECCNIIEFALRMLEIIESVNLENDTELNMRIGIHTGDVIAGVTGTNIVRYDIYGSDVMIANKVESSGAPGKILVSEATKNLIESVKPDLYLFQSHVDFFVKACKKKINTFFLKENIPNR